VTAGIVVKKAFSIVSGRAMDANELISVLVKSVPWAFFVAALRFGTNSLVANTNLVTKIYFPREIFPISSVLASMFDTVIASVVVAVMLFLTRTGISIQLLWVPILLILIVILTTGLALVFSCANLFFRDVKYLVEVVLTFGIFFTPVFYEARIFGKWAPLLLVNPIGPLLEGLNDTIVLHRSPDTLWFAYAVVVTLALFYGGWALFNRAQPLFAEKI
jgi:ABC-type polysaccharide/polyol phosphate export permease